MPDADGWESGLSPSEQLILDFVRQGMRDAEIAVRLGVSVGDGKERVAALIRKTGVPGRDGLAAWDGRADSTDDPARWSRPPSLIPPAGQPETIDEVSLEPRLVLLDDERNVGDAWPWGPRLPGLLFTASVAIAGIALLVVSTNGPRPVQDAAPDSRLIEIGGSILVPFGESPEPLSDENRDLLLTAIARRVSTATPTLPRRDGVALQVPRQGSHLDLPREAGLLMSATCAACPEQVTLFRIFRTGEHDTVLESLPPLPPSDGGTGPSLWISPDGAEAVALGYESGTQGVVTRAYRSRDGLMTWHETGDASGIGFSVVAVGPDHVLIEDTGGRALLLPEGRPFEPEDTGLVPWRVDPTGRIQRTPPPEFKGSPGVATSDGERVLVSPRQDEIGDIEALLLVQGTDVERGYDNTVSWPVASVGDAFVAHAAFGPNGLASAPFADESSRRPVLFEPRLGTFHPIAVPGFNVIDEYDWWVMAVQRGPFLRVIGTGETCASIRAGGMPDDPEVACAAAGVLLTDVGEHSGDWRKVQTPSGAWGWILASAVE
ncbi:MAG: hypothetical protein WD557_05690 [Dehalococcoidia bacterium]